MSAPSGNKKKSKHFYKSFKGRVKKKLDAGMMGFLITCNHFEREAKLDAYRLLNDYADLMYGKEEKINETNKEDCSDDDIEKSIEKELNDIKSLNKKERRFDAVDTGAKNVLFIKTTLKSTHDLIHRIMSDISEKKVVKTGHVLRILPVLGTCKVRDMEKLVEDASLFFAPFLGEGEGKSFCINFKKRNNNYTSKEEIITAMSGVIRDLNYKNTVDYENPLYVIHIDVIINNCCLSISKDFFKFKKYNLKELGAMEKTESSEIKENTDVTENPCEETDSLEPPPTKKKKDDDFIELSSEDLNSCKWHGKDEEKNVSSSITEEVSSEKDL